MFTNTPEVYSHGHVVTRAFSIDIVTWQSVDSQRATTNNLCWASCNLIYGSMTTSNKIIVRDIMVNLEVFEIGLNLN